MRGFLRRHHLGAGIAAAVLLLAAILLLSVRIQTVTVTGSTRYSSQKMEQILFGGKWGNNTAYAYVNSRFGHKRQIPFVEDYKIIFHSPFHAEVIVYEKSIVGYVSYMSSYMYFDRDGIIVESSVDRLEGVPLITGLKFGRIVLYRPLPVENPKIFGEILNLTQQLARYEISVDKIKYTPEGQASLQIGKMEVTLGDNTDFDGKISTLGDILRDHPELKEKNGTLELEKYRETNSGAGIPFHIK